MSSLQPLGRKQWIHVSTHHPLGSGRCSVDGRALRGVAVAEAVATDDHVVQGVVVLLCHLLAGVEQIVAQRVELRERDLEVRDLQHVCR